MIRPPFPSRAMQHPATRLVMIMAMILAMTTDAPAGAARLSPPATAVEAPAWAGEHRWAWTADDGETATLRLAFTLLPSGDYLIAGSFLLDDAELGVTGSGRWRTDRLVLDLVTSGGIRDAAPDDAKRGLYGAGPIPDAISASGFALFRADLSAADLSGPTQQYQTNVLTGDHVQGPVQRTGRLSPAK